MIKEIEHTADLGIEIRGKELESIFLEAGSWLVCKLESSVKNKEIKKNISLKESKLEDLLVCFLNEVIYFYEVEGIIFNYFKIKLLKEGCLEIECYGSKAVRRQTEIKAATYHKLILKREKNEWKAVVFFDV